MGKNIISMTSRHLSRVSLNKFLETSELLFIDPFMRARRPPVSKSTRTKSSISDYIRRTPHIRHFISWRNVFVLLWETRRRVIRDVRWRGSIMLLRQILHESLRVLRNVIHCDGLPGGWRGVLRGAETGCFGRECCALVVEG